MDSYEELMPKERLFEKWVSVERYTPEMRERTFYREAVRHILEDTIKTIESISLTADRSNRLSCIELE